MIVLLFAQALERGEAQLVLLAEDCDEGMPPTTDRQTVSHESMTHAHALTTMHFKLISWAWIVAH